MPHLAEQLLPCEGNGAITEPLLLLLQRTPQCWPAVSAAPKYLCMSSEHSHQLLCELIEEVEGESLKTFILLAVTVTFLREFALFPSQLAEVSS